MGILSDSLTVCRLCGLASEDTTDIFQHEGLSEDLSFYLPVEIKASGPFPKRICDGCHKDFMTLKAFVVKLNEGQALLAEQLVQLDNVVIKVPNLLADKKSLFREKYPWQPKPVYVKTPKTIDISLAVADAVDLPIKRARKLPKRLEESVQGNEFEKIFVKVEPSSVAASVSELPSSEETEEIVPSAKEPRTTTILNKTSRSRHHRNKCDICFKLFKLQGRLAHHRSTVHRGAYFQCTAEDCGKQYKTRESISLHQKLAKHEGSELIEPGRHICDKCNKSFPSKNSLDVHNIEEHSGFPLRCSSCLESFPSFSQLKDHSQEIHGVETPKGVVCDVCSKTFLTPTQLYVHIESEHEKQMNICRLCYRPFKNKTLLSRHLNIVHTDNRPYACEHCDLKFKSTTNLRAHQTMHTGEKKYSCEVCGKLFAYKTSLIQHIKLHDGDKPFQCSHCPKGFAQKGNLEEHIRTHTGEKPYACSLCEKRFTTSSQHKMHEKRHKGEKPWQCEHCPKAFLHKATYVAHIRRHKGEKPFSCQLCSKAFAEPWALKKHKRLHTGEKPYKCKDCGKAFADSSNLAKHSKAHVRLGDEITAKDGTVWNIIDHAAANEATPATDNNDVQQIIYIAYENETATEASATVVGGGETNKETAIHIVSQAAPPTATTELDLTAAFEEAPPGASQASNPTLHVISQQGLPLETEDNVQYVDLSLKEGHQIRLRVPLDADPIAYAKEYLQSMADTSLELDNA